MSDNKLITQNHDAQLVCAQNFAQSGFFKDAKTAAQAYVKIQFGKELGMGAGASMASINIIEGRPCLSGAAMAALIKASGKYRYQIITLTEEICTIRITENGETLNPDSTFTLAEAKTAALSGKNTWKGYGQDMLFNRAIGRAFRRHTPELAAGGVLYADGEITTQDPVDYQPQTQDGVAAVASISEAMDDGRFDMLATIDGLARQKWGDKFRIQLARFKESQGITGGLPADMSADECVKLIELLTPAAEGELV